MSWKSAVLDAFAAELDRHDLDEPADPGELGRRGALLTISEDRWRQHLGALLDSEQIRARLGVSSRQAVHDLVRRQRLLAVDDRTGRRLYPVGQLDANGRPWPVMATLIPMFAPVQETPWTLASWLASPQQILGGLSPAAWLRESRDEDAVLQTARETVERLAR